MLAIISSFVENMNTPQGDGNESVIVMVASSRQVENMNTPQGDGNFDEAVLLLSLYC